jgi:pSer/pThr/pTyr-binding forkhead associated (FHA) protein
VIVRASDDTREETVAELRDGLTSGRLGIDTFVRRISDAYAARTHDELRQLTRDLPQPHQPWWRRVAGALSDRDVHSPARRLRPPAQQQGSALTLGRSPECDYVVDDRTVSARHAELRRTASGWVLRDLGSRNGTRVNGWLVREQPLSDGDEIALGASAFVFCEPPG